MPMRLLWLGQLSTGFRITSQVSLLDEQRGVARDSIISMTHAPSRYENDLGVVDAKEYLYEQQLPPTKLEVSKLGNTVIKGTPVLFAAAVATGCAYVALNDPESNSLGPVCGFYATTGLYCPGCGMTRAVGNIVRGDILRATRFNAMLMLALPVLIYLYVWWVTWAFAGKELPKLKFNKAAIYVIIAFVIIFSVGRNLPGPIPEFFSLGRA